MILSPGNSWFGGLRMARTAFTLVELPVVMAIILLMVGLGVSAFKGGAASDATKGASVIASGIFDSARNEAIMRQTLSRVVIDTNWYSGRPLFAPDDRGLSRPEYWPLGASRHMDRAAGQCLLRHQLQRVAWHGHAVQLRRFSRAEHRILVILPQELRTVRVFGHALDEGGEGLIGEVALEPIPSADRSSEALHFELEEGT